MSGFDERDLLLIGAALLAVALAALAGWVVRGRRARRDREAAILDTETRFVDLLRESQVLTRAHARLTDEAKSLRSQLGTALIGREAAEAALDRRTRELEQAADALRLARAELAARELELDETARTAATAESLRELLGDRDRSLRHVERERQALGRRVEELAQARARLESEAMQLAVRVESLERDLARAGTTRQREIDHLRRALAAANGLVEQMRRRIDLQPTAPDRATPGADSLSPAVLSAAAPAASAEPNPMAGRADAVAAAERHARSEAELGALEAQARRMEHLVRQLEDRDALLRAAAYERDQAQRRALAADREQRESAASLAAATQRLEAAEALAADRRLERQAADRRAAAALRARDEAAALARRLSLEGETLRAELRERDARFRALARENDAVVQELRRRVAELDAELYLSSAVITGTIGAPAANGGLPPGDDLTRIRGIGPVLAARLRDHGVTTFRQIADWSDADIEQMGALLGAFPDRIRRDEWVGGARRLLTEG